MQLDDDTPHHGDERAPNATGGDHGNYRRDLEVVQRPRGIVRVWQVHEEYQRRADQAEAQLASHRPKADEEKGEQHELRPSPEIPREIPNP